MDHTAQPRAQIIPMNKFNVLMVLRNVNFKWHLSDDIKVENNAMQESNLAFFMGCATLLLWEKKML